MATDTYQMFQRAADYLSNEKGYDTGRLLRLADRYGYEAFANLAPPAAGRPDGGKSAPTDPDGPRQPSPQQSGADAWPSVTIAAYQREEGLEQGQVARLGDALEHVQTGSPQLAEVLEDLEADVRQELYRVKHWMAVLAALELDEQDWSQGQDLRRRELVDRALELLRTVPSDEVDGLTGGKVDPNEVTEAHRALEQEATRLAPEQLGEWLAESFTVQPGQAGMSKAADWIEWESPRADYFW